MICPKCETPNDEDARFCQGCGEPLALICTQCGTRNDSEARFCKSCGTQLSKTSQKLQSLRKSTPAKLQEKMRKAGVGIEGERKPVTILFADIVGSTEKAEKLDSEEWKEVVNEVHRRISEAVYCYEGTVAQLLGDGVLAFFGAPITHEDDPIRAMRAALDLQESIVEYGRTLQGYVDDLQVRVGIHTGEVVVGEVGSDLHMEYLAIGDAVNVAARLEAAAEAGTVIISEECARLIGEEFSIKDCGELTLKGKSEPIRVYLVVEVLGVPATPRGISTSRTTYIGREVELNTLRTALSKLYEDKGGIMAVLGEAGIGKSRLVEEARDLAINEAEEIPAQSSRVRWLEGRALSYGSTLAYWTITQLLLSDLGLSDGAPDVKVKVALRKRLGELFPETPEKHYPYLGHLLGLEEHEEQEIIQALDAETVRHQTLMSLGAYFRCVSEQSPIVILLEDFHWADPSTLEAVTQLLSIAEKQALLVLMVMRVERDHGSWDLKLNAERAYPHLFHEIGLSHFHGEQISALLRSLLNGGEASESVKDLIETRAEGNPFYMEEIIRHLLERGLIERVDGVWKETSGFGKIGIPATLQGVLLARIDRLEEDVRRTLQMASVIGKSFLYRILAVITEVEQALDEHLSELQRVELVREKSRIPELEYMFKHSLTQEAAYNSLLHERRRDFHRLVGEALEELFPDRKDDFLGLLAYHFEAAAITEKAVTYLEAAGDIARLEDALDEALDYYTRALRIEEELGEDSDAANTWLKIGLVHMKDFHFEQAHAAQEAAFSLQKAARRRAATAPESKMELSEGVLRYGISSKMDFTFNPGESFNVGDEECIRSVFSGLVEVDADMNVVPHIARSWEVHDGGTRYRFHLRDDVFWSDNQPVAAEDFRYAWINNLTPATVSPGAPLMDVVVGAQDLREGRVTDPDQLGVRAVDPYTLEILLEYPASYFIYLLAASITFPIPRHVAEEYGQQWCQPENIVSNGPFVLVSLDEDRVELVRNKNYFGTFNGNLSRMSWRFLGDERSLVKAFVNDKCDASWDIAPEYLSQAIHSTEIQILPTTFSMAYIQFNPQIYPMDDIRVRKAFAHAIPFTSLREIGEPESPRALGGIIPKGMPGYSPDIGFIYDPERAREYLAEAGFPEGTGFPTLELIGYRRHRYLGIVSEWEKILGVKVDVTELEDYYAPKIGKTPIIGAGWAADYPDPDSFLRGSMMYELLHRIGWEGLSKCGPLLEQAVTLMDRKQRLAIYREVDRILVEEQALIVPFERKLHHLIKPWVKDYHFDAMGYVKWKDIIIEPH